ncbi:XRE family transcriptional regulator [Rhodococcus jostii]|uniref:XRE family transcriptional regulator n=1 Tax=Rhodococcus jostii TaxID=132919 RepID=UPI003627B90F
MFLISLDELDRTKRRNGIRNITELAEASGVSRRTWSTTVRDRRPTPQVLDALARLGARPERVLIADEASTQASA